MTKARRIEAPQPTEHQIQSAYFDLVRINRQRVPPLKLVRAFPNGGSRPWKKDATGKRYSPVGQQLYAEGVEPGPPDVIVPVPRSGYCGLWFEFKRPGQKTTTEQLEYMALLHMAGWRTDVQYNAEIAFNMTLQYLGDALKPRMEAPMK